MFKCGTCHRDFETPQALGAHKALKCNQSSSGLPALRKRSNPGVEGKRTASDANLSEESRAFSQKVSRSEPDPITRSGFQKEEERKVLLSGKGVSAPPDSVREEAHQEAHQEAHHEAHQEAQQETLGAHQPFSAVEQPAFDFSPPDLSDVPDSSDYDYVKPLPSDFKPTVDFVRWVRSCNRNAGLPKRDVNGLFDLFKKGFHPDQLKVQNANDVQNFEADHLFLEKDGWKKHVLTRPGDPYEVVLFYQDAGLALRRLLSRRSNGEGFAFSPETKYDAASGRQRVSTPETATWWAEAQKYINAGFCLDAIIAALILYSDATSLSNDRRTSGWPLVLTLANIAMELRGHPDGHELLAVFPILRAVPGCPGFEPESPELRLRIKETFHESLRVVLQPLKDWSFSGIVTSGPDGLENTFYPLLFSYICDHPEGWKVTCTKDGIRTLRPCSVCMARASELNDVSKKHEYRNPADAEALLAQLELGTEKEREDASRELEAKSLHPVKSGLIGFNGGRTTWGNWYKTIHVDCMHQSDIGVFPTIMDAVLAAAAGSNSTRMAKAIESQLMKIRETCRFADLRIPGSDKGGYFTSKSRSKFTAFEQRAVMQVNVQKLGSA